MKPRALIYIRVRADVADIGRLAAGQFEDCLDEVKRLGAVLADFYWDIGASANDLDRRGLQDLRRRLDLPMRDIDFVVVTSPDRMARNAAEMARLSNLINDAGARLVICRHRTAKGAA